MVTATKECRAANQRAGRWRVPEPMQLTIFKADGGAHHWGLVAGATIARSRSIASDDLVEQAARRVDEGAAWARLDRRADAGPAHVAQRCDDLDAERRRDQGGSRSGKAARR